MENGSLSSPSVAFVFPGQGSQSVGMATAVAGESAAADAVIQQADDLLGFPLSDLMAEGPAEILEDTINAQPAILTTSIAMLAALRERLDASKSWREPDMLAGHSLGEFSALVAAGSLDFPTALHLVRERGRLMKQAGDHHPGGMAAILGLDDAAIDQVCAEASVYGVIVPANRNCPGQIVISGEIEALERAMELAKSAGAKRAARLGVSIASHSPLMKEANAVFYALVEEADLRDPQIPVVGNVTASPLTTRAGILEELHLQMEHPVDWTGTVTRMTDDGITTFVEVGPGNVLSSLIKRINREATISTAADYQSLSTTINEQKAGA